MSNEILTESSARFIDQLTMLAQTLNTNTEALWGALVRQGIVEGVQAIVAMFIYIGFILISIRFRKEINRFVEDSDVEAFSVLTVVVYVIAAIIASIIPIWFVMALGSLLNPEYFALTKLVYLFTGK